MASSEKTSTKPVKIKKEKSSKKRKLEAMVVSETSESTAAPITGISPAPPPEAITDAAGSPGPTIDEASSTHISKKRKASVEEIEVDITAPEPPSKKALRRLKKGKPLPPSKSGADSTPEPETKKKAEVEKRSEHGIWIGNLAFHISKEELRTFFVEKSDLTEEMITRIHMPGPNDKKPANKVEEKKKFARAEHNKGYAYVDFSSKDAVDKAVELSEELLFGRRVLIKDNKSFAGRPEKTKEESRKDGKPPSKRIFLGNLSFDTTEDSLKDHFEKCGAIASVKVATFEDTGKCKGYAWIEFEELSSAESAVRGFVLIEEEDSDASDFEGKSEDAEDVSKSKHKKAKTRKWWVNKIKGRPLRMEFAEDASIRYKKRYGKDGTKNTTNAASKSSKEDKEVTKPAVKVVEYRQPYAARLTGGIVESMGKKVSF
jgi:RNA recognition motif-containing protein